MEILMAQVGCRNVLKQMGITRQHRRKIIAQAFPFDKTIGPCPENSQIGTAGLNPTITGQFTEGRELNGVQLGPGVTNLAIGIRQLFRTHLGLHRIPFNSRNVGFDQVAPGPRLVGDIHGDYFGHDDGCVGGNQVVDNGRSLKRVIIGRFRAGQLNNHFQRRRSQLEKQYQVIVALITDFVINNFNT